jgi:hypothetical protein
MPLTNGAVLVDATAPLPLETNQWSLEVSPDLNQWITLTNLPGLQFSVTYADASDVGSNRFYRVESSR